MKEKLIARLAEMNKVIEQKRQTLQQLNADFNLVMGQHFELTSLINSFDELNAPSVEEPKPIDQTGEVV